MSDARRVGGQLGFECAYLKATSPNAFYSQGAPCVRAYVCACAQDLNALSVTASCWKIFQCKLSAGFAVAHAVYTPFSLAW